MQRLFIYLAALIVLFGAAYLVWTKAPRLDHIQIATSTAPRIEMRTVEYKEDTETYSIDVKYPQFGVASADAAVKGHVDAAVAMFKTYPANPADSAVPKNEQVISFSSVYTGDDYISTGLLISEYTGGAHPNSVLIGINVDLASGEEVSLDGVLALIGKDLAQVASTTDESLSSLLSDAYFPEGATAKAENYSTFVIDKDTVTFVFNNYQVAPYAAGAQEMTFARVK